MSEQYGLGEPALLEKVDKLFACGVGDLVNLPQIVVVGDQSSGKSSVLEGLIKKPLPRDSGLCTRFATQIVFRRATEERVRVSIVPSLDSSQEHRSETEAWGKDVADLNTQVFSNIMRDAHKQMGLTGDDETTTRRPTFSNDVLRLEISGSNQEHLSVIDVPGIFKSTTEGLTTRADIDLVRCMVRSYMENPRSVMLAVIPANVDVATQEILELATEADPGGERTLGVFTKPDLVDKGCEPAVTSIVNGHSRLMKLGWHIIRNPGQQELRDALLDRDQLEMNFFRTRAPWNNIDKSKVGIDVLRCRLKDVLSSLVKKEFPKVKVEIRSRLVTARRLLADLGPERESHMDQLVYLTSIATDYQRLVSFALRANHGADEVFEARPGLRIAPAIIGRMKTFSEDMAMYGATYAFQANESNLPQLLSPAVSESDEENEGDGKASKNGSFFDSRKLDDHEDLLDILPPTQRLPLPRRNGIHPWLQQVFRGNRGFELGTFNPSILATTMKKQCTKWSDISLGFVSDVITLVHEFIGSALDVVCPDVVVRNALRDKLSEGLVELYRLALTRTHFLLEVESGGIPITMNHYFNDNLQRCRQDVRNAKLKSMAFHNGSHGMVIKLERAMESPHNMSNETHTVSDIHHILCAYYKVTRKTFVDNVCKQAIMHCLLTSEKSPLALFSPVYVSRLSADALQETAGETPVAKLSRARLSKEVASLSVAIKHLGSS